MTRPHHPFFVVYLVVSLAATGVHGLLGPQARAVTYVVIAGGALVPLVRGLRGGYMTARPANWLLVLALAVLGVGNVCGSLAVLWAPGFAVGAEIAISLGHLLALASALSTAAIRGRNDLGGLIDVAVVSMAGGGLLWTAVIQPRLVDTGSGSQFGLLVNILVLTGVLGTLARLAQTAAEPIVSIRLILVALVLALVGNVVMAMTVGSLTVGRPVWAEVVFLTTYTLLGAIGVHPSTLQFAETPPARHEPLSPRRLAFLGVAMAVGPVVGAGRELVGFEVDGPLLALGTLSIVPLVMLRIGYLSAKRTEAERELTHQATHDQLTGLVNRAEFLRRLEEALARRAAGGGNEVLVIFGDLDGFKAVNDRLGHAVGDDLLAAVARRLRGLVAARDTLARYGGDEFLLLVETTDPGAAQASIGRRMKASLTEPFDLAQARGVRVGISLGAVVADRGDRADALVSRADSRMYTAKQRRRGGLAATA